MAGWLTIEGAGIDYPVMFRQGDNDYYLHHDFEGNEDNNGLLVLDKRCKHDMSGINTLIHGHNMKSGAIFGNLDEYDDPNYFYEHPTIILKNLYEEHHYDIFAVCKSVVYGANNVSFPYYNYITVDNQEQFDKYITNALECSLYDTGTEVAWGDRLITLSTCEYSENNGRLVILGRERNED